MVTRRGAGRARGVRLRRRLRTVARMPGRPAGIASGIRARYGVGRARPAYPTTVFRRRAVPGPVTVRSHHQHVHLHPVLQRHVLARVGILSPVVRQPPPPVRPVTTSATRTPVRRPPAADPRQRRVPSRANRSTATATSRPAARTTVPGAAPATPPAVRRTGPRPAMASRFTVRTAPTSTRPSVVRQAPSVTQPFAAPRAPDEPAPRWHEATPWSTSVAPSATAVAAQPALDLDVVTTEVLRRIEGRAVAQRERLGRGPF
jgi:hypothetical protein